VVVAARRLAGQYPLLGEIAGRSEPGSDGWCAIQFWLGWAATVSADLPKAMGHFTAARDAMHGRGPSQVLAGVLASRSMALLNLGRLAAGIEDGRRSLAMARELDDPAAEVMVLGMLGIAALYSGDYDEVARLIRLQQQITAGVPTVSRGGSTVLIPALAEAGDLAAAESVCAAVLAQSRDSGEVTNLAALPTLMADLDVQAGRSRTPRRTYEKGSRSPCEPVTGGRCSTVCGPARCCAPRLGAMPKPPRCGLPTVPRELAASRPEMRAGGRKR